MIDGEPAGMGIRESAGLVTDNLSFFACHSIVSSHRSPLTPRIREISIPFTTTTNKES